MNDEKAEQVLTEERTYYQQDIAEVKKTVLKNAKLDHPNDYGTQEYVFNLQMNAFKKLQNPPKEWLALPEYENINTAAAENFPEDFSTRLHVIEEEIKAFLRLRKMGF